MANSLFDSARQAFLEAQINWISNTIKCYLISTSGGGGWTPNPTTQSTLADVSAGSTTRVAGPVTLGSKSTTGGAADAADCTFTSVSGVTVNGILLYIDDGSGVESNFKLLAWIDTATGLPITPNGGDIIITWDNGVNKIFKV